MRTLIAPFLAFIVTASVYGCGPRDEAYDPSHFRLRGVLAPPEVVLPPRTRPGSEVGGLYTLSADSGGLCCFVATRARLLVRKDRISDFMRVSVYVPAVPLFARQPQTLTITFPSAAASTTIGDLGPGFHVLSVRVPPALRRLRGEVPVALKGAVDYVPQIAGAGAGRPHYALIMLSIYFE